MRRHLRVTVDGRAYDVVVEEMTSPTEPEATTLAPPAAPAAPRAIPSAPAAPAPSRPAAPVAGSPDDRTAPLAGVVLEINASVGDMVDVDDAILVLEAMKMKTVISAHKAGRIAAIHVKPGDTVEADQPLATIQ